jgi:hypothetical protein
MENKLIEWFLDDVMGELKRISLVSVPAIEEEFLLFNNMDLKFKTLDEDKRIVTGPAMRPDIHIPRKGDGGELYYGFFSQDTVRKAAELFFKKNSNANNTNLEHEFEIDGIYVFESWIVEDPEMDKAKALGFTDVRKGDWWVSMKVENENVWNNYLKSGLIRGFSVEVKAGEVDVDVELISQITEILLKESCENKAYESISLLFGGPGSGRTAEGGGGGGEDDTESQISSIDKEIEDLDKNSTQEEINKWGDKIEDELGLKGDVKDRAARKIAERNKIEKKKSLENKKKALQDEKELKDWADSLEKEIGISPSKAKNYVLPKKGLL